MKKPKCKDIYSCKQNDVELRVLTDEEDVSSVEPVSIDEIWVRVQGENGWTIVGFNDLRNAIKVKGFYVEIKPILDSI